MFDELPQPYKLIVEVLEEDILDASWEIIDEKYQLSAGNVVLDDDKEDGEEENSFSYEHSVFSCGNEQAGLKVLELCELFKRWKAMYNWYDKWYSKTLWKLWSTSYF